MKKFFAILSLTAFIAVSVNAQTPSKAPVAKKEVTAAKADVKSESAAPAKSCCSKANAACCKNNKEAKACTPEQKAACAKAAGKECTHGKTEASETKETKTGLK